MSDRHWTERKQRRAEFRDAADEYWLALTCEGWSPEHVQSKRVRLAAAALRLHVFEQGYRAGKRGTR